MRFPWDGILLSCAAVVVRLDRTTQYAAASRLDRWRLWNTGSPAFAGDDIEQSKRGHSRGRICPGFAEAVTLESKRAQGMPGVLHTRSLVCSEESTRVRNYRYAERSGIPCTTVLRLIRDLPGVPGLLATVAMPIARLA